MDAARHDPTAARRFRGRRLRADLSADRAGRADQLQRSDDHHAADRALQPANGTRRCSRTPRRSSSLWTSIKLGMLRGLRATLLGLLRGARRRALRFPGRRAFLALMTLPMVAPGIVLGVSLLLFARYVGFKTGFVAAVARPHAAGAALLHLHHHLEPCALRPHARGRRARSRRRRMRRCCARVTLPEHHARASSARCCSASRSRSASSSSASS